MVEANYPNVESMCRLCLKENAAEINIFQCEAQLSIPMRIMSCAGLEVQESDNLPKVICTECRYQLEKSFYFRKRSQLSDSKLRKHLRLLSCGKKSRVFAKSEDGEDEDDDMLEFEDSLKFIKKYDDLREERYKIKEHEIVASIKPALRQEILKEVEEEYENKIYPEMRRKMDEEIRRELREKVKEEVKNELKKEVEEDLRASMLPNLKDQCREEEIRALLTEVGDFLREKRAGLKKTIQDNIDENNSILLKIDSLENVHLEKKSLKRKLSSSRPNSCDLQEKCQRPKLISAEEGGGEILCETVQETMTLNYDDIKSSNEGSSCDQDTDSNGFFIIDDNMDNEDQDENHINVNEMHHDADSHEDVLFVNNSDYEITHSSSKADVTSYHIEENEESEPYIKRKSPFKSECKGETETNIVILNYDAPHGEDEHLEMVEFVNLADKKIKKSQGVEDTLEEDLESDGYKNLGNELKITTTTSIKPPSNRISDTPKTFKCESCPMQFSTENSYNRHAKTHMKVAEKGVSYQCPECLVHVSCKSALTRHMVIHTGNKPYSCEECGKSFVQREILKRHMQTHTGIKPYKCTHCDRDFAQKANLTTHINKNHREVPLVGQHRCPLCSKRFNHSSGLSRHLATHSGVAFQCTECDRTFSDRSSVKRHINFVHNMTVEGDAIK